MREKRIIGKQLSPNEELLWCGVPRQGFFFRASDWIGVPFSLVWSGAVFYITAIIWTEDTTFEAKFFMVDFIIGGLYLVFGRFIIDIWKRSRTFYGVTGERVIFVSDGFRRKVKSINFNDLMDVSLNKKSNGTGTITFNDPNKLISDRDHIAGRKYQPKPPHFEQIQNVQKVFDLIENKRKQVTEDSKEENFYVKNN